jgi:peptide/nickel transport system substrate-binding protein
MPTSMPSLFRCCCVGSLLVLTACTRDQAETAGLAAGELGGTVVVSTPAEPDNLMPPITKSVSGLQVEDLVFERLAVIGASLNTVGDTDFTPALASRWDWASDSLSVAFHLDTAARWHDGARVRAQDVAFTFAVYRDPKTGAPAAAQLGNIDSVTVRDSLTPVIWFHKRTPSQFFDAVMQVSILPSHLLATADRATLASSPFAAKPIGSGPFRLVRWDPGQLVELAADTTGGRRRAALDRIVFTKAPDAVTAFTRVAAGEADVYEAVRPDKVADVVKNPQLRLVLSPALEYSYLGFNLLDPATKRPHPVFGDRLVRQALTMATDRRAIVANIYDTLAVQLRGPFTTGQAAADPSLKPLPYSVDSANALLDAAGWVRGPDSLRRKNGKVLGFSMLVPSSSLPRMRASVLLQEQFRRVGADVKIDGMEVGAFVGRMSTRKFDAVLGGWNQDAGPGNARDSWSSAGASPGGNNFGAYRSAAFDAQLDSGLAAFSPAAMRTHFASAWRIIADDAPAIWLAEPRRVMAVHRRIQMTGMRPDAWWAGMAQWRIPAAQRIARDAIAPAPVP